MKVTNCTIGDVCEVFDGPHATPSPSDEGPVYLGIPSILDDGSIDYENSKRISWEEFPKWAKRVTPQPGDVVFSYEANLDTYAIIPEGFVGCLGRRMAIMRPNKDKILSRYLYYYMLSPQWKAVIVSKTVLGATVNRIPIATYPDFPIAIPDLETQQRIAGALSAYDELIENNRKQIKLLEEAAQRLYKDWFVDLNFPSHETTPIHNGLPEGWRRESLLAQIDYVRGRSYGSEDLCNAGLSRLINLNNIAAFGGWNTGAEKSYSGSYKEDQTVMAGDIVMAVTDMTKERRLVGHVARVPKQATGGVISMDLIKLVPKCLEPSYLYSYLRYSGIAEMIAMLANGTNVIHLKPDALTRAIILVPNQRSQVVFSEYVQPLFDAIEVAEQQIAAAREARDRLLPKLMSGEIEG